MEEIFLEKENFLKNKKLEKENETVWTSGDPSKRFFWGFENLVDFIYSSFFCAKVNKKNC